MIIAVDFDGTIAKNAFPEIGAAVPGAIQWLQRLAASGAELVLWTSRYGEHLDEAVAWCRHQGIPFNHVNALPDGWPGPKIPAHVFVDDKALGCPLISWDSKPYVDWDVVGPWLCELLEAHQKKKAEVLALSRSH